MKPNPLPFVLVTWLDAWKTSTEDATVDNAVDSHKPVECCTAGWLLRDDEQGVQVGAEYSPDGTHRNRSFIPRVLVVSVTPVRLTKARKSGTAVSAIQEAPKVPA
jgi:hypothetical protein